MIHSSIIFRIFTLLITTGLICGFAACKNADDPVPADIFDGNYTLNEVIEEYDPDDPEKEMEKFLAPDFFEILKSDFFDPTSGELVTAYKFFIDDIFLGLTINNETQLVGMENCPNANDINGVSFQKLDNSLYQLNMLNCVGREVLATYTRLQEE